MASRFFSNLFGNNGVDIECSLVKPTAQTEKKILRNCAYDQDVVDQIATLLKIPRDLLSINYNPVTQICIFTVENEKTTCNNYATTMFTEKQQQGHKLFGDAYILRKMNDHGDLTYGSFLFKPQNIECIRMKPTSYTESMTLCNCVFDQNIKSYVASLLGISEEFVKVLCNPVLGLYFVFGNNESLRANLIAPSLFMKGRTDTTQDPRMFGDVFIFKKSHAHETLTFASYDTASLWNIMGYNGDPKLQLIDIKVTKEITKESVEVYKEEPKKPLEPKIEQIQENNTICILPSALEKVFNEIQEYQEETPSARKEIDQEDIKAPKKNPRKKRERNIEEKPVTPTVAPEGRRKSARLQKKGKIKYY